MGVGGGAAEERGEFGMEGFFNAGDDERADGFKAAGGADLFGDVAEEALGVVTLAEEAAIQSIHPRPALEMGGEGQGTKSQIDPSALANDGE
jgi:hypothetical protein